MKKKIIYIPLSKEEAAMLTHTQNQNTELLHFDFWLCHTNFPLSKDNKRAIDNILGVESFNILTPYRFVISVAKMFDMKDVRKRLENIFKDKLDPLDNLKDILNQYVDWIIYVLPNGETTYSTIEDPEFENKVNLMLESQYNVGGEIFRPNMDTRSV